ncbi:MAG: 50S ribosomal protein L25 [Acidobacteria bacterium]|nr:50S ribosomal protein L25 [Acidobacteriota bacterium]
MAQFTVQAEERQKTGKGANRRLRMQGKLPAVVYGQGLETLSVSVNAQDVDLILHSEAGHNTIFQLQVSGKLTDVLIKAYQLDPVKGSLLHADFQAVALDQKMTFAVPVQVVGTAQGVIAGGVLDQVLREIEVECLPTEVPDHIPLDVTELEIGDSVRVGALQLDNSKISLLSAPDLVILSIVPPHVEEEVEEIVEEEELEEPELIKKGKAEEEEKEEEGKEQAEKKEE